MSFSSESNFLQSKVREFQEVLRDTYPDLTVSATGRDIYIRGSFPIVHEGETLARYQIEIQWPLTSNGVPVLRETAGKIPWVSDRHVNPSDGLACPLVPEDWLLRQPEERTILRYLNGPVRDFFIGQSFVDLGKPWPWPQRQHGYPGLIEAYGDMVGMQDETSVRKCLDYLSRKFIKGHWECPCGSGRQLRRCHLEKLKVLQTRIPRHVAKEALARLANYTNIGHQKP